MNDPSTLLVIVQDRLSDLVRKGEVTPRYYNPGELFERVHILMTNDDVVDPQAVQLMVGRAQVHVHHLPAGPSLFVRSLGWRPGLLRGWMEQGLRLIQQVQPDLIRCHVNSLNGLLAAEAKRRFGIPLVVSLHINPDDDLRRLERWTARPLKRLALELHRAVERAGLEAADAVVCVYPFLVDYARGYGARRTEVIYNAVGVNGSTPKSAYELGAPAQLINVGRQFEAKDPSVLLRAAADLPEARVTLVGDGPGHERLRRLAQSLGMASRTDFVQAWSNEELCRRLPGFDVFVSVNAFGGISKAVLEAMAAGLPILANDRLVRTEPMSRECVLAVEHSVEAFRAGLSRLLQDASLRRTLGTRARQTWEMLQSEHGEPRIMQLYREVMSQRTPVGCSSSP